MRQQVIQWIEGHMTELLADFFEILRIRSVAEPEERNPVFGKGCQDVLRAMLALGEKYGFETQNYDGYVGRISCPGETEEEIGIWAHLDVVDDKDGRGFVWEYPPYEPTLKNDAVIARGSQDNKSSALAALYVLRYLKEHGLRTKRRISLYVGLCEEQGMQDMDYFTAHYPCPALSLVPDAGFPVCQGERGSFNGELTSKEPLTGEVVDLWADSGLYMIPDRAKIVLRGAQLGEKLGNLPERISLQRVGAQEAEQNQTLREGDWILTCSGESIHAANPWNGVNALQGLLDFLAERDVLSAYNTALFDFIRQINADYCGTALGVCCEDELSGKIVLAATQAKMTDGKLQVSFISKYPVSKNGVDFAGIAGEKGSENGFELKVTRNNKANFYPSDHPALALLTNIYNEITGDTAAPYIMSGGTYARKLPNAFAYGLGIRESWPPEGMFPPGHGDYHQPDEGVSLYRIKTGLLIYICSILELDHLKRLTVE